MYDRFGSNIYPAPIISYTLHEALCAGDRDFYSHFMHDKTEAQKDLSLTSCKFSYSATNEEAII